MADEKDKIAKLEERLEKAASTFKDMKVQLEEKEKENETLKTRITELEDELTLNGGAVQEVEGLKGRLEKAKEIFATQKAKIAEITELCNMSATRIAELEGVNSELTAELKKLNGAHEDLCNKFEQIKNIVGV